MLKMQDSYLILLLVKHKRQTLRITESRCSLESELASNFMCRPIGSSAGVTLHSAFDRAKAKAKSKFSVSFISRKDIR